MTDPRSAPRRPGSDLAPRKERRRQYRVEVAALGVQLQTDHGMTEAMAVDASAGGIAVAVHRGGHPQLQRRERITVVLSHPNHPPIELRCLVVRQQVSAHDTTWYGLRFLDRSALDAIPADVRQVLNRRAAWRVRPRRPVEIEVTAAPADAFWRSSSTGWLLDVSQVGVGFLFPPALANRFDAVDRMALRFDVPGADATVELTAQCAYRVPYAEGVRFGARIDYVEQISSSRARSVLRDYVMRRMYEDAWLVAAR